MGLVTIELDTNSHSATRNGLMGAVMAEIRPPDLNILDAIWIGADPYVGPQNSYANATRRDELVASIDPVAADMWAVTNILIPGFLDNGFSPPWPQPDATPDDPASDFRTYLDRSMSQLLAAGYDSTNDLDAVDVYSIDLSAMVFSDGFESGDPSRWSAVVPRPARFSNLPDEGSRRAKSPALDHIDHGVFRGVCGVPGGLLPGQMRD